MGMGWGKEVIRWCVQDDERRPGSANPATTVVVAVTARGSAIPATERTGGWVSCIRKRATKKAAVERTTARMNGRE